MPSSSSISSLLLCIASTLGDVAVFGNVSISQQLIVLCYLQSWVCDAINVLSYILPCFVFTICMISSRFADGTSFRIVVDSVLCLHL